MPDEPGRETAHSFSITGDLNLNGAIGCAIGPSNNISVSDLSNNTTGAPQPIVQLNGRNRQGTKEGSNVVNSAKRQGKGDGHGPRVAKGSESDNIFPDDENEDKMSVDQDYNGGACNGGDAHILNNPRVVNISGSEFNSIAGSSSKTTNLETLPKTSS